MAPPPTWQPRVMGMTVEFPMQFAADKKVVRFANVALQKMRTELPPYVPLPPPPVRGKQVDMPAD